MTLLLVVRLLFGMKTTMPNTRRHADSATLRRCAAASLGEKINMIKYESRQIGWGMCFNIIFSEVVLSFGILSFCPQACAEIIERTLKSDLGKISARIDVRKSCIKTIKIKVDETDIEVPKSYKQICGFKDAYLKEEDDQTFLEIRYKNKKDLLYIAENGIWASYHAIPYDKQVDPLE
jgi:hypothetical protein